MVGSYSHISFLRPKSPPRLSPIQGILTQKDFNCQRTVPNPCVPQRGEDFGREADNPLISQVKPLSRSVHIEICFAEILKFWVKYFSIINKKKSWLNNMKMQKPKTLQGRSSLFSLFQLKEITNFSLKTNFLKQNATWTYLAVLQWYLNIHSYGCNVSNFTFD